MKQTNRLKNIVLYLGLFLSLCFFISSPLQVSAKVTGVCGNCHTMHNSQQGSAVARTGTGAGWNGSGQFTGGTSQSSQGGLLVTDCVGCHSSTSNQTIINIGGSKIPIVYNTTAPAYNTPGATNALAGGNFYWVTTDQKKGHNVYGITAADSVLTTAPGKETGCSSGCHVSLAAAPSPTYYNKTGCQGCHVYTSHHTTKSWYRFLKGHTTGYVFDPSDPSNPTADIDYVVGLGDANWEQNASTANHNYYLGTTASYTSGTGLQDNQTITSFCSGCHGIFHGPLRGSGNTKGMGSSTLWVRHPTDITLPTSGEYSSYDPVNNYNVQTPVAWLNPSTPARADAVVMCLSCHRAHGSPYSSMLRWDYTTSIAGGGASGGCLNCHTGKQ